MQVTDMKRIALLCVLSVAGCAIHQKVEPVPSIEAREICIINNPDVRESFLDTFRQTLHSKGFQTKVLDASMKPGDCPLTSTYVANWRWDLALYMAFAEIEVYADGKQVGRAYYDSLSGSGNLSKFISADDKIEELVNQLFPYSAPVR